MAKRVRAKGGSQEESVKPIAKDIVLPPGLEHVDIASLTPYVNNSRTHKDKQIEQICGSILEFGWTKPIVVDESGMILAGHGAYEAAKKLELQEVPVVRMLGLNRAQKKAYVIADNRIAENSAWDRQALGLELEYLKEEDFSLDLLGFGSNELSDLLGLEQPAEDQSEQLGPASFAIIIECSGEKQQVELLGELEERGIKCRALS